MGMTPIHPNCFLERPLTGPEMMDMIEHEGLVTLEGKEDIGTAQRLEMLGFISVVEPGLSGEGSIDILNDKPEPTPA